MKNAKPLVSIIVPVYNAQDYLARCIDSILHQEYKNYELLLVDDGSTDSSGEILDNYAKNDNRINVYHRKNCGVSSTRNFALSLCKGEYIQFLDSDDWIPPDSTKLLVRCALEQQCDLVIADFYRVVGERISQKGDIEDDHLLTRQEFANYMVENPADFYYGVLWNKLYRAQIIKEHHIRMDSNISWCEDFLFNLEYIRHSNTFYALQAPVYYYFKRKGSLVSQEFSISNTIKTKLNVFDYYNQFYKDTYKEEDYENIRLHVYSFFFASAKDNTLPPIPMKGVQKLGKERSKVIEEAIRLDGIAGELYRMRKLFERLCGTIAAKNNLTLEEVVVLFMLVQNIHINSVTTLADLCGYSKRKTASLLQRLVKRKFIQITNRSRSIIDISLLGPAQVVLADMNTIPEDFSHICFEHFTEDEIRMYHLLTDIIKKNTEDILL